MGRALHTLLGDVSHTKDFDSCVTAISLDPPASYDTLLRQAEYAMDAPASPFASAWSARALSSHFPSTLTTRSVSAGARKYKPVDRKVRPVPTYMPNPSAQKFKPVTIPVPDHLPHNPPPRSEFVPTERLTQARLDIILSTVPEGFLSSGELDLLVSVLVRRQDALAFDDGERGIFSREFYPDYEIPIIEHTPWVQEPIRIPKAIESDVRQLLQDQRRAGKYEDSCASYRSRVFPVVKSTGKLRLVHDLQEMNKYVIRDASLPPRADDFAESFVGRCIYGIADLFSGFDACTLAESSRDLTTFHCLNGPERLTVLPQGCTNSVQEFQRRIRHALIEEIPNNADAFIDDVGIKGGDDNYDDAALPDNPRIRIFVYDYAVTLDRVFLRFIVAGVTASGLKLVLATPRLKIVGSIVSREGWHLAHGITAKVLNWPTPRNVSDVRGFLGVAGVGRRWIKGFSIIAKPLTSLCRKTDDAFVWTDAAEEAMRLLQRRVTDAPVLRPVDYDLAKAVPAPPRPLTTEHGLVILAVDSSIHGSGWILYQIRADERNPALFGSCTFNAAESRYSQPKVELYGVFRALKEVRYRVWGLWFRLEVDAKFLEQMIKEPDLPNAPMTRWITYLRLFSFQLRHVPAEKGKGQDGMSRRGWAEGDSDESDAEEYLDKFFGFHGGAYNCSQSPTEFVRASLHLAYRYEDMLRQRPLGVDRVSRHEERTDPAFTVTHFGLFTSDKADSIAARADAMRFADAHVRAWDANIVRGQPAWCLESPGRAPLDTDTSPYHPALLRNEDDVTYIGHEFMVRKEAREHLTMVTLGDDTFMIAVQEYRPARLTTGPLPELLTTFRANLISLAQHSDAHHRGDTSQTLRDDNWGHLHDPPSDFTRLDIPCIAHAYATKDDDSDVFWEEIINHAAHGEPPSRLQPGAPSAAKQFHKRASRFVWRDNRLWRLSRHGLPRLVIVDKNRRGELVAEAHIICGHRGRDATYTALKDRFFWPNMYDDIAWHVRSCNACQYRSKVRPVEPLSITLSPSVFRRFVLDTIHMPDGLYGFKYLMHASCSTGKWPEARATRKNTSAAWRNFIWEDIICRFGCVPVITCDGGPEFKAAARELLEIHGVAVILSSPYHPQGNGIAERDGKTLQDTILKCCGDSPRRWPLYVHAALFAVRVTTSRATGYTPYFLTYGQHALFPFDISDRTWHVLDWDEVRTTEDLLALRTKQLARREEDIGTATEHLKESRQRAADDANRRNEHRLRDDIFEPGTWVLIHETWLDNQHGNKGALRWAGPYAVVQRHPSGSYALRELDGTLLKESVAGSRLKIFHFRDKLQTMVAHVDDGVAPAPLLTRLYCGIQIAFPMLSDVLRSNDRGDYDVTWVEEDHVVHAAGTRVRHRTNIREIIRVQEALLPWDAR